MVKDGQKACVGYVGTFEDGTVFDKSADHGETFDFIVGSGNVIAGFDEAVRSMEVGDKSTVRIEPKDAYGEYSEEAVQTIPVDELPNGEELKAHAGGSVYVEQNGELMEARIIDNGDGTLTFDFNHPMAGRTLIFEITLEGVSDEPLEHPAGPHTKSIAQPEMPPAPGEIA